MTTDNHWRFYAACNGQSYLFDSVEDYNGRNFYPYEEEAKEICDKCPVRKECREAADGKRDGIWDVDSKQEVQGIWAGEIYPRKRR